MSQPSSAGAAISGATIERAARLADEEESLLRKLLRVRMVAGVANAVLVLSGIVYAIILMANVFINLDGSSGELGVIVFIATTVLEVAIAVPCLWARRWPARIQARLHQVEQLQRA